MWRELFGSSATVGDRSTDGKALGGTREAAVGVCALARGQATVDSAEAAQEIFEGRGGDTGEDLARNHGLQSREVGGVGPRPRLESIPIDDTSVSEEIRVGQAQHQTAKAFIPERPGNETP